MIARCGSDGGAWMAERLPDPGYKGTRPLLTLVLGCAAAACVQPREVANAAPPTCSLNVIVALDTAPDGALLTDLSRVSGARLEFVRSMTSNLYLLALEAQGASRRFSRRRSNRRRVPPSRSSRRAPASR